jgi:hypothetical protein
MTTEEKLTEAIAIGRTVIGAMDELNTQTEKFAGNVTSVAEAMGQDMTRHREATRRNADRIRSVMYDCRAAFNRLEEDG